MSGLARSTRINYGYNASLFLTQETFCKITQYPFVFSNPLPPPPHMEYDQHIGVKNPFTDPDLMSGFTVTYEIISDC